MKRNPLALVQLPDDAQPVGYKQTRPYHWEQVFYSESLDFEGTEDEFLASGFAYEYTQASPFTRITYQELTA
jgi:hypothetical protein